MHLEPGKVKVCMGKFGHGKGVVPHERRASGAWTGHIRHCEQACGCRGTAKVENVVFFPLVLQRFLVCPSRFSQRLAVDTGGAGGGMRTVGIAKGFVV